MKLCSKEKSCGQGLILVLDPDAAELSSPQTVPQLVLPPMGVRQPLGTETNGAGSAAQSTVTHPCPEQSHLSGGGLVVAAAPAPSKPLGRWVAGCVCESAAKRPQTLRCCCSEMQSSSAFAAGGFGEHPEQRVNAATWPHAASCAEQCVVWRRAEGPASSVPTGIFWVLLCAPPAPQAVLESRTGSTLSCCRRDCAELLTPSRLLGHGAPVQWRSSFLVRRSNCSVLAELRAYRCPAVAPSL